MCVCVCVCASVRVRVILSFSLFVSRVVDVRFCALRGHDSLVCLSLVPHGGLLWWYEISGAVW